MASSDTKVTNKPATIEVDTDERTLTIDTVTRGQIAHKSGARVFLGFEGSPVTTGLAADGTVFLDAGDTWPIPKNTKIIKHKTTAASAILFFNPDYGAGT